VSVSLVMPRASTGRAAADLRIVALGGLQHAVVALRMYETHRRGVAVAPITEEIDPES
jgi:hypothetical protein